MTLREQLRRSKTVRGRRWTIRRDKNNDLTEIKMIYNPQEYIKYKNDVSTLAMPMLRPNSTYASNTL